MQKAGFCSDPAWSYLARTRAPTAANRGDAPHPHVEGRIMAVHTVTAKDINALAGHDYPEAGRAPDFLRGLLARLEARIAYWLRYRATVADLECLTDRQLADIGISRGNIAAVARIAASA
jgi:uncharacterized protein YjiS (DUF1127 family)